jgi:integrase
VIGRLNVDDFKVSKDLSQQRATALLRALQIVSQFSGRRLWDDGPTYDLVKKTTSEPSRRGTKAENIEKRTSAFQPFPDEFTAQAGWRLAWASKNLGPNVLELGRLITEVFLRFPYANDSMSARMVKHWRKRDVELLLRDFQWRSVHGQPIDTLPFEFRIVGTGAHDPSEYSWPPRLWTQFQEVFKLIQAANLFIFFLSVGSRISEALSLKPGCVIQHPDGISLADGMTYKISLQLGGETRDWALPDVAIEALKLQEELVKVAIELGNNSQDPIGFDQESGDVLWLQIGSRDPSQGGENAVLNRMIEALGLTGLLGDSTAHSHRFRKTLARLAALAITGAPKILMDLFGHKTIEMTLHYVLSDPLIRSEIADIAKAQTIMFVGEALANIENCGGKAAKLIKPIVTAARARHGRDFGERELRTLAELLTLGGTQCQIVREGVLCMKNDLQAGPCAKGIGTPEPSRCCTPCEHRLETHIASRDADSCLSTAVEAYSKEKADGNDIMLEFWSGQVLTHLPRFDNLKNKWSAHPVVQEIRKANLESSAI